MSALFRILSRAAATLAIAAALPAAAERPIVESIDGTAFVRDAGSAILGLAGDIRLSASAREERLRAVYRATFDSDAFAARVAGRAWRGAPGARRTAFADLVERYFAKFVAARLGELAGARLEVIMSEPEGDALIVYSRIVREDRDLHVNVRWRLAARGGEFRIHDLAVESMSVTLRLRRTLLDCSAGCGDTLEVLAARLGSLLADHDPPRSVPAR